jgi:histidinol dehydrogenase
MFPANIAGCSRNRICTPDTKKKCKSAILFAANLCGVTKILKVGGIQAIAGMTFGTESIQKVYKIFWSWNNS